MFLRKYEMVVIADPARGDEGLDKTLERMREGLTKTGGKEVRLEHWGRRRLSYPLNKQMWGTYSYMLFLGTNETVAEMERLLNITEPVMKFQTIFLEDRVDPETFDFAAEGTDLSFMAKALNAKTEAAAASAQEASS